MLSFLQNVLLGDKKNRHSEGALIEESVTKAASLAWRLQHGFCGPDTGLIWRYHPGGWDLHEGQPELHMWFDHVLLTISKSEFTRSAWTSWMTFYDPSPEVTDAILQTSKQKQKQTKWS